MQDAESMMVLGMILTETGDLESAECLLRDVVDMRASAFPRADHWLVAEGKQNIEIAEQLGIERTIVGRWRRRFVAQGLGGLEKDAPRGGRPANTTPARKIVEHTTQRKPPNATHWSTTSLAKVLGTSRSTVSRVWRANGLKPHLVQTFKVGNDPRLVEKLIDVVGLYLDPPERAIVFCVDEKSRFQV